MKTQSCKAKGRRLQQQIVEDLYKNFELGEGDLKSTSMGAGGEDVQMSARARELIPYSFEAKNQERLNVWSAIEQAEANCSDRAPVVVIKKNKKRPYALLPWETFVNLISKRPQSHVNVALRECDSNEQERQENGQPDSSGCEQSRELKTALSLANQLRTTLESMVH